MGVTTGTGVNNLELTLMLDDLATPQIKRAFTQIKQSSTTAEKTVTSKLSNIKKAFIALGGVMIGLAAIRVFKNIINSAVEFESAFAGVKKTVDATDAEFKILSDDLRSMSKEIPVAVTELARIEELAGQLGVRGVNNLSKFTETIAKIGVTTNLSTEEASTSFARIANIMQEPIDNIDRMGASTVELGNNFATTEAEIVNFSNRIAGAGKVAGLSTADILGIGTAFSSVGVGAERGGTAVNKALVMIATSVQEGGENLEKFATVAGMGAEEFKKAWEEDAGKAFAIFIEGIGNSGLEGAAILKDLELSDQRLIQSFLSVGGASGILTNAINTSNEAFKVNTALNEEAAKRFGTTASQIQLFQNNVNDLCISIGNIFIPILNKILPVLNAIISGLEFVAVAFESVKSAILSFFELISQGITNLLEIFGALLEKASELPFVGEQFEGISDKINGVTEYMQLLTEAFGESAIAASEASLAHIENITQEETAVKRLLDMETRVAEARRSTQVKAIQDLTKATVKSDKDKTTSQVASIDVQDKAKKSSFDAFVAISQASVDVAKATGKEMKGIAIAQAVINTAVGVARAFADYMYPLSLVVAALVGAAGAVQIATIAGASFAEGTDTIPAMVSPGEMIFPRSMADAIRSGDIVVGGRGSGLENDNAFLPFNDTGGQTININIDSPVIRDEQDITSLVEQISDALNKEAERI